MPVVPAPNLLVHQSVVGLARAGGRRFAPVGGGERSGDVLGQGAARAIVHLGGGALTAQGAARAIDPLVPTL